MRKIAFLLLSSISILSVKISKAQNPSLYYLYYYPNTLTNISAALKSIKSQSVKIGNQTWMTKNLDVTTLSNGDPIPDGNNGAAWVDAYRNHTPAWCWVYQAHHEFGKFYNGWTVRDKRGLAPKGWHVASSAEWQTLFDYLGGVVFLGNDVIHNRAINKLTSKAGWFFPRNTLTNSSGFSALALGFKNAPNERSWWDLGKRMLFYTATYTDKNAMDDQGCSSGISQRRCIFFMVWRRCIFWW